MEPMKTTRKVLQWLCMFPLNENQNTNGQRRLYISFTAITLIALSILSAASAAFIAKFVMTDLESALYALFPTSACIGLIYMITIGILSKHKVGCMFKNLSEMYTLCKDFIRFRSLNSHSNVYKLMSLPNLDSGKDEFRFLAIANTKSEKMWKYYMIFGVVGHFIGNVIMFVLAIVGCYLAYHRIDVQYLYRPYREM